ncbi:GntR family transcriptional regulator [uncultured Roseobacter sp.]|uniref:GntR family transcriptional regulator n=1 Tax=uncultured Roseobacter sp. TaxID=114847 RepID=UPI00261D1891|nr:GntR family transcriptional regulator [uncultured Roseobacter sp.]
MNRPIINSWQSVEQEVRRRIQTREWAPGELIPNEADLALEFGCARATVNRALRRIADSGLIDRRRKAGTRVALQPVARATLDIPVIRREIEDRGMTYSYLLLSRTEAVPPHAVSATMQLPAHDAQLHVVALHLGNETPYALEDRWISLAAVPAARQERFESVSSNEWLLANAPWSHGQITFAATQAGREDAARLACDPGQAMFVIDRLTWNNNAAITRVRLKYPPGYQLRTDI